MISQIMQYLTNRLIIVERKKSNQPVIYTILMRFEDKFKVLTSAECSE